MGKYKIEVWQYHSKIDEFSADDPKKVDAWYKKKYGAMDDWGECCYYKFVDGKDLDDVKQAQKDALTAAKAFDDFTDDEKDTIIELLINSICGMKQEPPMFFDPMGGGVQIRNNWFDPDTTFYLREFKIQSGNPLFAKVLNKAMKRMGYTK